MTDENLGTEQNSAPMDTGSQDFGQEQSASIPTQQNTAHSNDFISREEAGKVAAANRQRGYEKGMREAQQQLQQQSQQVPAQQSQGYQQQSSQHAQQPDIAQAVNTEVQRQIEAARQAQVQSEIAQLEKQIESNFTDKLEEAKKIEGFDASVVGNFASQPNLKIVAAVSDDAPMVLDYLAKNPSEAARLNMTASSFQHPNGQLDYAPAQHEFKKIAERLKMNENGKKFADAPSPLSQVKSDTRDGTRDASPRTAAEWQKHYENKR